VVASVSASPDDEKPVNKKCVVVATPDDNLSRHLTKTCVNCIDDPSVEVTNLNKKKIFQINFYNFSRCLLLASTN
jgi:hypothetical protein